MNSVEKKLKELSKKSGYPLDEIEEIYREKYEKLKKKYSDEAQLRTKAYRQTLIQLKREARFLEGVPTRYVYVIGESGLVDRLDRIRRKALNMELEEAVAQGLMTPDGKIIDTREQVYGKPNPNYGSPLPDSMHSYQREIYGIVSDNPSFEECQLCVIRAFDERAEKMEHIPIWRTYAFRARDKTKEGTPYRVFNVAAATRFSEIPDPVDPVDLLNKFDLRELHEIADIYKACERSKYRHVVPILGYLENAVPREESVLVFISNGTWEGDSVMCIFPPAYPVEAEQGDEIAVFGSVRKQRDEYRIDAWGYMVRYRQNEGS
mgnify:CR=1 FL=1